MPELSGSFWIGIAVIGGTTLTAIFTCIYRMKCRKIELFSGCLTVERDIQGENQSYLMELQHPITPQPSNAIPFPSPDPNPMRGSVNNV